MELGIDYSPHGLLANYCMQCPDPVTGKTGDWAFIGESHKTGKRISPVFDGLFPLLQWMQENRWELYRAGGLFSIRKI